MDTTTTPPIHLDGRRNAEPDIRAARALLSNDAALFCDEVLRPRLGDLARTATARFALQRVQQGYCFGDSLLDALDAYSDDLKAEGLTLTGW